jgi:plastocyanin
MKPRRLVAVLAVIGAGCSGSAPAAPVAVPDQVTIQGFAFNPSPRTVTVGTTVSWVNRDGTAHTSTGGSGAETWDSGSLSRNESFAHTFSTPGTYQYECSIHPGMHGTIIVNQ